MRWRAGETPASRRASRPAERSSCTVPRHDTWRGWRAGRPLAMLLLALPLFAQQVASTPSGVLVAHDGVIELGAWKTDGVKNPTGVVVGNDRAAVLDAIANRVCIIDFKRNKAETTTANETPIAGVFISSTLYLLGRDARALERIGADGARASVVLAADPAFLRERNGILYVYSRTAGIVQEITTAPFAVRRTLRIAPFASDFELSGDSGYLVYPRAAKIRTFSMADMKTTGELAAGAVPVDLAFAGRSLALADPSAKRVWLVEGAQSVSQAFARGFLRGLLGLGLFDGGRDSAFPTGIDRVVIRGANWIAYDSSSGTLYRFTKSKSSVIARGVAPGTYAVTPDGVVFWRNGMLVAEKGN
ncbi:MAG TPA: hypothetical protein VJ276_10990 [Thermoanaerobaculia bacterium]|nr:hypothetical protein [Thermoanaerobaculia bacterium]